MKNHICILLILASTTLYGNGINVSNISFNSSTNQLSFDLYWENSFTLWAGSPDLFDAAWVFIKYAPNGGDNWLHAEVIDSIAVSGYVQYISYDDLGLIVYKSTLGVDTFGPQMFTLELAPLLGQYQDFRVFATEMVFVDGGDFNAGDGASTGRFYADGDNSVPWNITSEDAIMRGEDSGDFNQEGSGSSQHLSAGFPKGWGSIYCMKYKITAQQYVDFLNTLTRGQQESRVKADISGTTASNKYVMTDTPTATDRNPIACDVNIGTGAINFFLDLDGTPPQNSANDGGNIVMNHISPADILAYMDWAGLRPISELEYEKFCRGEDMPAVAEEYAWGTDTYNDAGAVTSAGTDSESTANVGFLKSLFKTEPLRAGFSATSTSDRTDAGGTFWGMMDMHNLGEFMYGVESDNFARLQYGDGALDALGNAEQSAWTDGAQFLASQDPEAPTIEPISKGKTTILSATTRSANVGARGVRRLIFQ